MTARSVTGPVEDHCAAERALQALLREQGPLDGARMLDVLAPILGSVALMHTRAAAHGGIEPGNVFVMSCAAGNVTRSRLGPASAQTALPDTSSKPQSSASVCVAPELRDGGQPSIAGDVWSLGALMFACLWGDAAMDDHSTQAAWFDRTRLHDRRAVALIPVVARALEHEPTARYANVHSLARALVAAAQSARLELPRSPHPLGLPDWDTWQEQVTGQATLAAATDHRVDDPPLDDSTGAIALRDPPLAPVSTPRPGSTLLDRFELRRRLGVGAMGAVFEAFDRVTEQHVALKLLHRCEPQALYRIKREFRSLADVAHPNLVAMHDLCVDPEVGGFLTMDLIAGQPFLDYVRHDEARLRSCLEQLTRAVQHLHAHDRLHCDLKPSNVLVSKAGHLTVVDFGLASTLRAFGEPHADERAFEGTPAYAAPEQLDPQQVSYASDWYAVGVMLYEALAEQRPFSGNSCELLHEKALHDPPLPSRRTLRPVPALLEEICMRLLARDPVQRATGQDLLAALGKEDQFVAFEMLRPCVGRDAELTRLEQAFERAHAGATSALLIAGPSGMGKTHLAQHFLETLRAQGRARIFHGRCFVQEALHYNAFDGIIDALSSHMRALPLDSSRLIDHDAAFLLQLFPVLQRVPALQRTRAPAKLNERELRANAFAALRRLLLRLAEEMPLVLFIDDLQWADADSVRLLQELVSPALPRVWLLATHRSDTNPSVPALLELLDAARFERLPLGPMSEGAVSELARVCLDSCSPEQATKIARKSAGYPLFANELIRHASLRRVTVAEPEADIELETALRSRLATLSASARELLEVVCLAGQRLPRSLLLGTPAVSQLATLRELRVSCAVRESTEGGGMHLEPYHDRIRELVVQQLQPERRRTLHSLLADGLRAHGEANLESVVQHYVLAERMHEAGALAEQAAQVATRRLAFHSAADLLELALEHAEETGSASERQRLLIAAAEASGHAGRTLAAAEHYERAAASAEPKQRGELLLRGVNAYFVSGHLERGRVPLDILSKELAVTLEWKPMSKLWGTLLLWVMLLTGAPRLRRPARQQALQLSAANGPSADSRTDALHLVWTLAPALLVVDPEAACYFASRALIEAANQGISSIYGQALSFHLSLLSFVSGRRSRLLDRRFARARTLATQQGDYWGSAMVRVMESGSAMLFSEFARSLELSHEAAMARELTVPIAVSVRCCARSVTLPALYWSGRLVRLAELAEAWTKEADDGGDRHLQICCRVMGAHRHLRNDDIARAHEDLDAARAVQTDYPHNALCDPWWQTGIALYAGKPEAALAICVAVRDSFARVSGYSATTRVAWNLTEGTCAAALAARGIQRDESMRLLARCLRRTRRARSSMARPVEAHLAGALALLKGQRNRGLVQLRRAVERYDALDMRLHAASVRMSLAQLEPERGAELQRAALAVFAAEGISVPLRWAYMLAPGLAVEWA